MPYDVRHKISIGILTAGAVLGAIVYFGGDRMVMVFFEPTESFVEPASLTPQFATPAQAIDEMTDLDTPWEIVFLPDSTLMATERGGQLVRKSIEGSITRLAVPGVIENAEAGLLGMTLHPDFATNNLIYIFSTTKRGKSFENRVIRYRLKADALEQDKVIIDRIPGSQYHDGGRIAFGPDGMLYITTGDAGDTHNAQDTDSLAGKILRLTADGGIPTDNPFGNATWSYGHRNPQGIAWDDDGRLWSTEHGRSGAVSGFDELNLIVKGGNYGWPRIQGDEQRDGMITPVVNSGSKETWAPSGLAYADGRLYFTGLRGASLYEVRLDGGGGVALLRAFMRLEHGRLRAVAVRGPRLYVSTSNRDGRGQPRDGDDRILRIDLAQFQ